MKKVNFILFFPLLTLFVSQELLFSGQRKEQVQSLSDIESVEKKNVEELKSTAKKKTKKKSAWKKIVKNKYVIGGVALTGLSISALLIKYFLSDTVDNAESLAKKDQEKKIKKSDDVDSTKDGLGTEKDAGKKVGEPVISKKVKSKKTEEVPLVIKDKRAHAAVLNGAVGDALGRITEFKATNTQNVTKLSQAFYAKYQCVPYTDDTVMAKIVLEECSQGGSNDQIADRLAIRFRDLLGSNRYSIDPLYGIRAHGGRNGQSASELASLSNQVTSGWWKKRYEGKAEAALTSEGGCGSVMRAWPIGLVFNDLEQVIDLADKQSCITHALAMPRAASVAMAVGTMLAYQGKSIDQIVEGMVQAAARYDDLEKETKPYAKKIQNDAELTSDKLRDNAYFTSDMIRYAAKMAQDGRMPEEILGTNNDSSGSAYRSPQGFLRGWAADEAVAAAVYLLVRNGADVNKAIIEGVNTPGDSDSIASLAGVLVGAYSGKVFDDPNLEKLENKEELEVLSQKKVS